MCDEGFVARMGASVVPRGILAPFAFTGALKGNSPASLVDKGEPVGADRMILGAPSEGAGLCMSCVSFRLPEEGAVDPSHLSVLRLPAIWTEDCAPWARSW
jgi:hypothetical protein